jgi:hypothetical protein
MYTYYLYDTETRISRGWVSGKNKVEAKQEAENFMKDLKHKWYHKYLILRTTKK